jgi:hypothetical protein
VICRSNKIKVSASRESAALNFPGSATGYRSSICQSPHIAGGCANAKINQTCESTGDSDTRLDLGRVPVRLPQIGQVLTCP